MTLTRYENVKKKKKLTKNEIVFVFVYQRKILYHLIFLSFEKQ